MSAPLESSCSKSERAVEFVSHDGDGEIEVDLDDHGGGKAAEAEEGELLGDGLLDEPVARVSAQDVGRGSVEVVGQQQGGVAARAGLWAVLEEAEQQLERKHSQDGAQKEC